MDSPLTTLDQAPHEPLRSGRAAAAPSPAAETAQPLPGLWTRLRRRGLGVVAFALSAGLATYALMSGLTPAYRAETRAVIMAADGGAIAGKLLADQVQLIASRATARRVVDRLRLDSDTDLGSPDLWQRVLVAIGMANDSAGLAPEERAIDQALAHLSVDTTAWLGELRLRAVAADGGHAADIANAFMDDYVALQAGPTASAAGIKVRVVARATPPDAPYFPRALPTAAAVAGFALVLVGLAVALAARGGRASDEEEGEDEPQPMTPHALVAVAEQRFGQIVADRREERRQRIRAKVGATVEAVVEDKRPPLPAEPVAGPEAAANDHLYAMLAADGRSRVAFIGLSHPGAGRLAIETVCREAADEETRVVVIDTAATSAQPGLADLIVGTAEFGDIIRRNPMTRAHEIGAGTRPLRPELVRKEALLTTLEALQNTYDLVLMDLGLMRADAVLMAFMGYAERIVLVGDEHDDNVAIACALLRRHGFDNLVVTAGLPPRDDLDAA